MKVPYGSGVATRPGRESCTVARKGGGEASAAVRAGQPLNREMPTSPGGRGSCQRSKATPGTPPRRGVPGSRAVVDPVHARKLLVREPGEPTTGPGGMAPRVRADLGDRRR